MTRAIGRLLTDARNCIVNPDEGQCRTLARIDELLTRLDDDRLRVAALGQFKRGKSTLLNALLGATLLPMGVTPVTAIPTFIRIGDATRARIVFEDGTETVVKNDGADISDSLAQFVSEAHNPKNEKRVASVAIETPAPLLEKGVILVDTPGVGSVYAHNTAAAVAALAECDAALFVLSADLPITEVEVHYLEKIRKLIPNIVFVLNKADYDKLQREEGLSDTALGPREERVMPQFVLWGEFYADTEARSKTRSDIYLCTYKLTRLSGGDILWEHSYETHKSVNKTLLD